MGFLRNLNYDSKEIALLDTGYMYVCVWCLSGGSVSNIAKAFCNAVFWVVMLMMEVLGTAPGATQGLLGSNQIKANTATR